MEKNRILIETLKIKKYYKEEIEYLKRKISMLTDEINKTYDEKVKRQKEKERRLLECKEMDKWKMLNQIESDISKIEFYNTDIKYLKRERMLLDDLWYQISVLPLRKVTDHSSIFQTKRAKVKKLYKKSYSKTTKSTKKISKKIYQLLKKNSRFLSINIVRETATLGTRVVRVDSFEYALSTMGYPSMKKSKKFIDRLDYDLTSQEVPVSRTNAPLDLLSAKSDLKSMDSDKRQCLLRLKQIKHLRTLYSFDSKIQEKLNLVEEKYNYIVQRLREINYMKTLLDKYSDSLIKNSLLFKELSKMAEDYEKEIEKLIEEAEKLYIKYEITEKKEVANRVQNLNSRLEFLVFEINRCEKKGDFQQSENLRKEYSKIEKELKLNLCDNPGVIIHSKEARKRYYDMYMSDKLNDPEIRKMTFAKYLETKVPYETELIEREKSREISAKTAYKDYLQYCMSVEDGMFVMSFEEFTKKNYHIELCVPLENEEEYERLRKR